MLFDTSKSPVSQRSLWTHALMIAYVCAGSWLAHTNAFGAPNECSARGGSNADCGQHNMMIVGQQAIFLSHLPMFESEHRFQVILEVGFMRNGASRDNLYAKDRNEHSGVRMYTLQPSDRFVLARLFSGDEKARRTSFVGTVFRGHLERAGVPLNELTGVDISVRRVVYAGEIGPPRGLDRATALEYIVFGKGQDMFLAHRITQPPDFDQLLNIKIAGSPLTDDDLNRGVMVTMPGRPNEPARRLHRGETAIGHGRVTGAHSFLPIEITVIEEPYFEEGELASKFSMDPTPLEIEAGFGD